MGVMQGRLSPPAHGIQAFPRDSWADELTRAATAGLACIEWIYDAYGEDVNPIGTADGVRRLRELAEAAGVEVRSLCADWFMEWPFLRGSAAERSEREDRLAWLIAQCGEAGIRRIVLPFVDGSALDGPADVAGAVAVLERALPACEGADVVLHLETSLPPAELRGLLESLPSARVGVAYDTGNSAALGFSPAEELAAYGERIGSVHVKDRPRGGTSVSLGSGNADLHTVFAGLQRVGYGGDLILQTARGESGDEVAHARRDVLLVTEIWLSAT